MKKKEEESEVQTENEEEIVIEKLDEMSHEKEEKPFFVIGCDEKKK